MMKKFLLLVFAAGFCTVLKAQPDAIMDMVNSSASKLIDSVMNGINIRSDIFNEEKAKVNKARPLDTENLTKEKIGENLPTVKEFLSYLEVYRATSDMEKKRIADSVAMLRAYLPKSKQKKYLKEFVDAYAMDESAFYKYTVALTSLYSHVIDLMQFMQNADVEVADGKIMFKDRKQLKEFEKIQLKIEKQLKKQASAGLAAQKATFEAGQIMQKAYGKLNQ